METTLPELIDTHCHLHDRAAYEYFLSLPQNRHRDPANYTPEKLLDNARANGVQRVVTIGTSHADSLVARAFAAEHAGVYWSYGIHPEEDPAHPAAGLPWTATDPTLATAAGNGDLPDPIAIGEVGLDYHTPGYDRARQIALFEQMLELAAKADLPLIFHVREAFADFWPIVDNAHVRRAVVHSFSDDQQNLDLALNHDFYIGVNGLATLTHLPHPPLERVLLETDAPFLAPQCHRGRPNQPAYVKDIAEFLAKKHHVDLADLAAITTNNAHKLFNI